MSTKSCCVIMVRVSTQIQDTKAQISELKEYAKAKGFTEFKVIEAKESGYNNTDKRAGLNEMQDFLLANPIYKTVFVTEISRLARRQSVLHSLKDWFISNRVQLIIKDDKIELLDADGVIDFKADMGFSIFGTFAENEMRVKKERFKRAKAEYMKESISVSGKTLFGYKKDYITKNNKKRSKLEIDPENAKVVQEIFDWYLNGITSDKPQTSAKKISRECKTRNYPKYTHSVRNVRKLLSEEGYTGHKFTNNKRKNPAFGFAPHEPEHLESSYEIRYPQIITRKQFDKVQAKIQLNNQQGDKTRHISLLSRLLKCPVCGNNLLAHYRNRDGRGASCYRCATRAKTTPCGNTQTFSMSLFDSAIWALIKQDFEVFAKVIKDVNPNANYVELQERKENNIKAVAELEEESKKIRTSLTRLIANLSDEDIDNINSKIDKIKKEIDHYQNENVKIESDIKRKQSELADTKQLVEQNLDEIENSKEELKRYFNAFIDKIEIIVHNVRFSVLKVSLKNYSVRHITEATAYSFKTVVMGQLEPITWLIIDKNQTIKPKLVKVTSPRLEPIYTEETFEKLNLVKVMDSLNSGNKIPAFRLIPFSRLKVSSSPTPRRKVNRKRNVAFID